MTTRLMMPILGALLAFVAPASAFGQFNPTAFYHITAKHSEKCLTVAGRGDVDGDPIIQADCHDAADNQKWQIIPEGGAFKILSKQSGKALDVRAAATDDRAPVQQWVFINHDSQKWKVTPVGDGFYQITAMHSGKSLDVNVGPGTPANGANVQQWQFWGGDNQKWRFDEVAGTCRQYGDRGIVNGGSPSVSSCCTASPDITRLQGGFCEGISPDLAASDDRRHGAETTIAFVPAFGGQPARLIMGYNGTDPTGFLQWSISTDQGRTWRDKNRCTGGSSASATSACPGPGATTVGNPIVPFNSYRGDLSVVALPGIPGGVAMVSLADRFACAPTAVAPCPDLVVLLISIDGGETFKTSIVNDRLGVGITDQPRVTVDPGDGTIWVLWRARLALAPYYTYIRGGRVEPSGTVSWFANVDGQMVFSNPIFPTIDYQHPRIKVFHRPGAPAGTHTVAIAGPQAGPGTSFFSQNRCKPGMSGNNTFWQYPLGVFFAVSEDDGRHWTDLHSAVEMGQPFALGCVGGTGGLNPSGPTIYSENRIDLARDSRNGNYLVTRARAVSDPMNNAFVGQQVEVWRRSVALNARFTRVWPAPASAQPGGSSNPMAPAAPWSASNPWQFNPSIAARDDGQIAVSYYQISSSTQVPELMVIGSRDGGTTWSAPVQLSRNGFSLGTIVALKGDRGLGEYDEIVALPTNVFPPATAQQVGSQFWPGTFYASWSNGVGRVFAAGFTPPPPER